MAKCYFELRKTSKTGGVNLAADMMRHLHTRQYLGKAVVICERPSIFMANAHKQWLKLSRTIQKQRASTLNAEKILKYTHTITHMQHLKFVARSPLEAPSADVYFLRRDQLELLPLQCLTVYVNAELSPADLRSIVAQLPSDALFVDYTHGKPWQDIGVKPKRELELKLSAAWKKAEEFLASRHIDIAGLFAGPLHNVEAMDNALDSLLEVSHAFLQVADSFNHALGLARPMRISKTTRQHYDVFTLLAHRVQALSTIGYTQRFLETYNEDDTFFLYDSQKLFLHHYNATGETLAQAITRHQAANRPNLARALQQAAQTEPTPLSAARLRSGV